MKRFLALFLSGLSFTGAYAQPSLESTNVLIEKLNPVTAVKNQGQSGTCWCFSGTSMIESQFLRSNNSPVDLSEMFTVRNIYMEKAKNYFLRQGHAQFGEGGLGHDVIRAIDTYGAVPESVFTGLPAGKTMLNHSKLVEALKSYLDSVIVLAGKGNTAAAESWKPGVDALLTQYIGNPPAEFTYEGKNYTPKTFAVDYLKFNANDYVNITSFTDHPYYKSYIISVPDNFSNGAYYNVPLSEMIDLTKNTLKSGYTILWDADVSNNGFSQQTGLALNVSKGTAVKKDSTFSQEENNYTPEVRQQLFDDLITQDDHLMHIVGLEKNKAGKSFFVVKNSWGTVGPYKGYINVSEPYFAINTISMVVPKASLSKAMQKKLGIN